MQNDNWIDLEGPVSSDECKVACADDDIKWQWVNFDNNVCSCIELIEYGNRWNF